MQRVILLDLVAGYHRRLKWNGSHSSKHLTTRFDYYAHVQKYRAV